MDVPTLSSVNDTLNSSNAPPRCSGSGSKCKNIAPRVVTIETSSLMRIQRELIYCLVAALTGRPDFSYPDAVKTLGWDVIVACNVLWDWHLHWMGTTWP